MSQYVQAGIAMAHRQRRGRDHVQRCWATVTPRAGCSCCSRRSRPRPGPPILAVGLVRGAGQPLRHHDLVPADGAGQPVAAAAAATAAGDARHVPPLADGRQPRGAGRGDHRAPIRSSSASRPTTTTSASWPTRARSSRTRRPASPTPTTTWRRSSRRRSSRRTSPTASTSPTSTSCPSRSSRSSPSTTARGCMSYFYGKAREEAVAASGAVPGSAGRGRRRGRGRRGALPASRDPSRRHARRPS